MRSIIAAIAILFAAPAGAATDAGTILRNQATATYFDAERGVADRALSNFSTVRVRAVPDLTLVADRSVRAQPGAQVTFLHRLTNTGNIRDSFALTLAELDDTLTLDTVSVHHDRDEDGIIDPDEPAITRFDDLAPGTGVQLIVAGRISTSIPVGGVAGLALTATSDADPTRMQRVEDRATVVGAREFAMFKTSSPACETPVGPGSVISYTIDLDALDTLGDASGTVVIDGQARTGAMVLDEIPANTSLVPGLALGHAPVATTPVMRLAGEEARGWISYDRWDGSGTARDIALFLSPDALRFPSGQFAFDVRVNDEITPGTRIVNTARIDLDGDERSEYVSNPACNRLQDGAPGVGSYDARIRFLQPTADIRQAATTTGPDPTIGLGDLEDTAIYRLDDKPGYQLAYDGVYLTVNSTSLNTSVYRPDGRFAQNIVNVQVTSRLTGDTLLVAMQEVGFNTGVFRALEPFRLAVTDEGNGGLCAPETPDACVLRSARGDVLRAQIFDPGMNTVITDAATVDPTGIVFDSVSLEPVAGAVVVIRNRDGSVALDPDRGGASTIPVQTTGVDGTFQYPRLYPGDYYVSVDDVPAGFEFPSAAPQNSFAGSRTVGIASYGRDGFTGAAFSGLFTQRADDLPPVFDIPLDPDLTRGSIGLEKTTTADIVGYGDVVPYTVIVGNTAGAVLLDTRIEDRLPFGFKLEPGSVTVDGVSVTVDGVGPTVTIPLGRMDIGDRREVAYVTRVTAGARPGVATNRVQVFGETGAGLSVSSPEVTASVRIVEDGLFGDQGFLIGRVSVREQCHADEPEGGWPLGGARLYLEDGTYAITDEDGFYSLYGIKPGMHALALDPMTVPGGLVPRLLDARQADAPWSRFVDMTPGELHRANFSLACPAKSLDPLLPELIARRADAQGDWMLEEALRFEGTINGRLDRPATERPAFIDGDISKGIVHGPSGRNATERRSSFLPDTIDLDPSPAPDKRIPDAEAVAKTLTKAEAKAGTWLWPLEDVARDGRFMVVVRGGLEPELRVNGTIVGEDRLGERIANKRERGEVLAWYGVPLESGENLVEVVATDTFGNERILAERTVRRPGEGSRLRLSTDMVRLPADGGTTAARFAIAIEDKSGVPVSGVNFVTVEASDGTWVGSDLQPKEPGWQVRVEDGSATVSLRSSDRTGPVLVRASTSDGLQTEMPIRFVSPSRDLIAVGILDVTGRVSDLGGAGAADAPVEDGFRLDKRAALFIKGRIKGDLLLTLAYDSEADSDDVLFRDIDPNAFYPIYGDSSVKGYEAQSRSKLYVRVERGKTSALYGDYRTDYDDEPSFGRVQRALTGVNLRHESEDGRSVVSGFAARPDRREIEQELRGNGTALFYTLSNAPILRGSEIIELVIRDRDNRGRIISSRTLSRFGDYVLDERTGRIDFAEPIPSVDADGNAVFIRASYEAEERGEEYWMAGVRARHQISENLVVSGSATRDEQPTDERDILSATLEAVPAPGHHVLAEVAMQRNRSVGTTGRAGRFEYTGIWADRIDTRLFFGRASKDFTNSGAPVAADRMEGEVEISAAMGPSTDIGARATWSESLSTGDRRAAVGAGVAHRTGDWTLEFGGRFTEDKRGDDTDRFPSVVARAARVLRFGDRAASAFVEAEQDVSDLSRSRVAIGGDIQVHEKVRFYGEYELFDDLPDATDIGLGPFERDVSRGALRFGVETTLISSMTSYTEYRIARALDGKTGEAALGIRGSFDIVEGIAVSPAFEHVHTLDGPSAGDAVAASLGVVDTRDPRQRRSGRVEFRYTEDSRSYGGTAGWAVRFTPDWSLIAKGAASHDVRDKGEDRLEIEATAGIAHRPRDNDFWHALALYQFDHEDGVNAGERRTAHILATHHNLRLWSDDCAEECEDGDRDVTLSGRLAAKWANTDFGHSSFDSNAQLAGMRLTFDTGTKLDFDLRAGALSTDWGESVAWSAGVGVGVTVAPNVRVSAGYNFGGFRDRDLDQSALHEEGIFFGIDLKLSSDHFDWLAAD